jgi:hypothetical protein
VPTTPDEPAGPALSDKTTLTRVRSAGFDHRLTKPANFDHIDSILRGDIAPLAKQPLRQASRHL